MRKLTLFVIPIVLMLLLVSASETFKQNSEISLKAKCTDIDGNYCSTDVGCWITIFYPNSSVMTENQQMSHNPSFYNYTIAPEDTMPLGTYNYDVLCNRSILTGSDPDSFEITPTGFLDTPGFYFLIIGVSLVFMLFGIYLIKDEWITLLSTIGLYFVGIHFARYGFADRIEPVSIGISVVTLGVAIYVSLKTALEIINNNY